MSYINRKHARQTGTNRTTQAKISNTFWLGFPGRVTRALSGSDAEAGRFEVNRELGTGQVSILAHKPKPRFVGGKFVPE